jgi:hypothetical protein
MSNIEGDKRGRVLRSLQDELVMSEESFETTSSARGIITTKLMEAVKGISLVDDEGRPNVKEDDLNLITTTLKALGEVDKSTVASANLKLRNHEIATQNASASKDRIAAMVLAARTARIEDTSLDGYNLEDILRDQIGDTIKEGELRANNNDLSD